MRAGDCRVLVRIPAHRYLSDHAPLGQDPGGLTALAPPLDHRRVRRDVDQVVCRDREFLEGPLARQGDADADRFVGDIPDPRRIDLEVLTPEVDEFAGEQLPDDLDGLGQHVETPFDGRPALADDVFVEVLTAAQSQREPPVGEDLHGRGLLGHDGRVIAHRRAGDVRIQVRRFGGVRDRPEHRPRVRGVPLAGQPGREVVTAHFEIESRLLRRDGVMHKIFWPALLRHQRVSESRHGLRIPVHRAAKLGTRQI